VQDEPGTSVSQVPPELAVNLYSKLPASRGMVISQIPSELASVMGAQTPHQLLKVPLRDTLERPVPFMSTLNVTLNANAMMELRAISIVVIRYFFIDKGFGYNAKITLLSIKQKVFLYILQ
jgi:hypothetical protein